MKDSPVPPKKVNSDLIPEKQLELWVEGKSQCPNSNGECCPDFSCCMPKLQWDEEKRKKFVEAEQGTRQKMLMGALSAALALAMEEKGEKIYITRGIPEDNE